MKNYVPQLDYLKCIFILLMILFHLVYIGDSYPYIKDVVYTFHMPIFLILSGYLSQSEKSIRSFLLAVWWLFVPYACMETGYVLAASLLPVRESVGEIGVGVLMKSIFVDPIGPYWYLHTLLLCRTIHYFVKRIVKSDSSLLSQFILLGLIFWGVSDGIHLMNFGYSMYFLLGIILRECKQNILSFFQPTIWSIVPLIILCLYPNNLIRFGLGGIGIVYLTISLSLWIYPRISNNVRRVSCLIGRNTLVLLLFSPLFTMLSRFYQPFFSFDSSGGCFAFFTLFITVLGCFGITWCMDKADISKWFFGRKKMLLIREYR